MKNEKQNIKLLDVNDWKQYLEYAAGVRMDATQTAILAEELERKRSEIFETKYVEFMAKEHIPIDPEGSRGEKTVTYSFMDETSKAERYFNGANNPPVVTVSREEFSNPVISYWQSYRITTLDRWRENMANVPIEASLIKAARRSLERRVDDLLTFGNADEGVEGFVNNSNVPVTVLTNGAWDAPATTAEDILADLVEMENAISLNTLDIEKPTDLIIPPTFFGVINTKFITGTSTSALDAFLERAQSVQRVSKWQKLENAGPGGVAMAIMYKKDPSVLTGLLPVPLWEDQPVIQPMSIQVPMMSRCGGTVFHYPFSATYAHNIGV